MTFLSFELYAKSISYILQWCEGNKIRGVNSLSCWGNSPSFKVGGCAWAESENVLAVYFAIFLNFNIDFLS